MNNNGTEPSSDRLDYERLFRSCRNTLVSLFDSCNDAETFSSLVESLDDLTNNDPAYRVYVQEILPTAMTDGNTIKTGESTDGKEESKQADADLDDDEPDTDLDDDGDDDGSEGVPAPKGPSKIGS